MRIYKTNEIGEKMYQLECTNMHCKCSLDSVITIIWSKSEPIINCKKCNNLLIETMSNWVPLPKLARY